MNANPIYPVTFNYYGHQGYYAIPFSSTVDIQPLDCNTTSPKHILLSESVDSLVIGTYNVLFPQKFGRDKGVFSSAAGYNVTADRTVIPNETWRLQIKIKNILNARPNSLSLQEVTQDEFEEYQNKLEGYVGVFCLHPQSFHGVAIFYKSDQFNLIGAKKGIFQYKCGKCVVVEGGYGLKTLIKSRAHLLVDLQDKMSGFTLRMVSCHLFDPRDWVGKVKSSHVEAIVDHAIANAPYSIDMLAICGDMNQDQFGDDVTTCLKENPEPVSLENITAFRPFLKGFVQDKSLLPTEYDKDLSQVDGEMLSKKRKTDWIFIKTKKDIEVEKLKGVVLKSSKISNEYPNLKKKEHDLRGSDHVITLTKIQIKRTFF